MKIVFRISKLGFGGAEQVFMSLAKEFSCKYKAEILFVVDNNLGKNYLNIKEQGFKVINLNVKRTLFSIFKLAKFIKHEQPDVLLSAYTDTNAACILSSLIAGSKSKVIVSEHASLKEHWKGKNRLKRFLLKFYVSYVYRFSDHITCVSQGLSRDVIKLLKLEEKVSTIYNPVRFKSNDFENITNKTITKLLAVGRISVQKDYLTLLYMLSILKNNYNVHLTIVGGIFDDIEYNKLCTLVAKLNITKNITFAGYTDKVENYYEVADIFVLSSAWEGFGNVIVEAMAFGLPIVSTNCNYGPSEILENGKYGRLVSVGDYKELAAAITDEMKDPLVTPECLRRRALDFSESKIAEEYYKLIEKVVNA